MSAGPSATLRAGVQPRGAGAGAAARGDIAPLTERQRELLIDQAILMLEELYAHLPLKRALHATDPIQRLRLLRLRHEALDEREFQSAMIDIFVGLRDLHTNYILPSAYHPKYAVLPFRVEEYYENEQRKYLVSAVSPVNTDPNLTQASRSRTGTACRLTLPWRATPAAKPAATRRRDARAGSRH